VGEQLVFDVTGRVREAGTLYSPIFGPVAGVIRTVGDPDAAQARG